MILSKYSAKILGCRVRTSWNVEIVWNSTSRHKFLKVTVTVLISERVITFSVT